MKKMSAIFLIFVMMFTLAGCRNSTQRSVSGASGSSDTADTKEGTPETDSGDASDTSKDGNGGRALVVYFSRTGEQYSVGVIDKGNTAIAAEIIGDKAGADLWEVIPADDRYPMTYDNLTDVAKREQNDDVRPAYAGEVPDLSQYTTVFIGAPVWWGDWPMIMYTFFEKNREELAGKTLIPFSTHEGSGLSGFDRKLSSVCPNSNVARGLAIRGKDCQNNQDRVKESVDKWLAGLGF